MSQDYTTLPRTHVRYSKRAVEDESWIKDFLSRAPVGVLATVHGQQPFINSNLFVYDEVAHCIYMHTAKDGRTRANVEQQANVCFSVFEMGRLLPADTALEFSVEYAGVVVFGTTRIVEDETEQTRALQLLLDKYCPHLKPERDYRPIHPDELKRTSVYCIHIEEWSGKQKQVGPDFPGAFTYPYQGE